MPNTSPPVGRRPSAVDRPEYLQRKRFFEQMLTVFGRKPVLEALSDPQVPVYRLHLAESNRPGPLLDEIVARARSRGVEILGHSREGLARISRNARQDQGVAADLLLPGHQRLEEFLQAAGERRFRLLALDRITNPQNLGMIIRSVCAGELDGLLLPRKGSAAISPLVIKASAGTVFRATLVRCERLGEALALCRGAGAEICCLGTRARESLFELHPSGSVVYVLGNETEGVSAEVSALCDRHLVIPMSNGVESLNVAVTAALIAFRRRL